MAVKTTDPASAASNEGVKKGKNDTAPGIDIIGAPDIAAAAFAVTLVLSAAPVIVPPGDDMVAVNARAAGASRITSRLKNRLSIRFSIGKFDAAIVLQNANQKEKTNCRTQRANVQVKYQTHDPKYGFWKFQAADGIVCDAYKTASKLRLGVFLPFPHLCLGAILRPGE
jgi:hypothetical protein